MELESYLVFVVASIFLCVVPGPDMVHLLARTLAQGRRPGLMAALGMNVGGYVHLLAVIAGLSALLATSAIAFSLLKWLGAIYLIYLGIKILLDRSSRDFGLIKQHAVSQQNSAFWQGFISDILNPKVALFFLAFLPQFISNSADNKLVELLLLGTTVNIIALIINMIIVNFAVFIAGGLRTNQRINRWLQRLLGFTFVALGVRLANEKA